MNLRKALIFSATKLSGMALRSGTAMAQTAASAKPNLVPHPVVQYRAAYEHNQGGHSGDWVHCEFVTKSKSTLTWICTRTVAVAEFTSATLGFTDGEISTSVGFNVTYTAGVNDARRDLLAAAAVRRCGTPEPSRW